MGRTRLRLLVCGVAGAVLIVTWLIGTWFGPIPPQFSFVHAIPVLIVGVGFSLISRRWPGSARHIAIAEAVRAKTLIDVIFAALIGSVVGMAMGNLGAGLAMLGIVAFACVSFWLRYVYAMEHTQEDPPSMTVP